MSQVTTQTLAPTGVPVRHSLPSRTPQPAAHDDSSAAAAQRRPSETTPHATPVQRLPSSASSPLALSAMLPASAAPVGSPQHHSSASVGGGAMSALATKPAVVECGVYRFVIHDAPTDGNLPSYLEYLKRKRVVALVRACEATYDKTPLEAAGIRVAELPFQDGSPPPDAMIEAWCKLITSVFHPKETGDKGKKSSSSSGSSGSSSKSSSSSEPKVGIAVHCVAGLGRAPVLVCIALIEFCGLGWMESVELVRKKRRGALNLTQLRYLETYKPRFAGKKDACAIM